MIPSKKKVYYNIYKVFLYKTFFYCTVCLSVTSLSHASKEERNLLEYDSQEESKEFHLFYIFGDYITFLFRNTRCYSSNFQLVRFDQHI